MVVEVTHFYGNISYRRYFSIYRIEGVLFQLKIRGTSEKFKNQPRPLLRPRSVNFRQHFRNLSRKTVPLKDRLFEGFLNVMKYAPVSRPFHFVFTQLLCFPELQEKGIPKIMLLKKY
jgi:hypothetical protein